MAALVYMRYFKLSLHWQWMGRAATSAEQKQGLMSGSRTAEQTSALWTGTNSRWSAGLLHDTALTYWTVGLCVHLYWTGVHLERQHLLLELDGIAVPVILLFSTGTYSALVEMYINSICSICVSAKAHQNVFEKSTNRARTILMPYYPLPLNLFNEVHRDFDDLMFN